MCGCLVLLIGSAFPRLAIFLLELFSDWPDKAMSSFWIGLVGFLFLPYTTLFYILLDNWQDPINGFGWFLVAIGFVFDVLSYTGTYRERHSISAYPTGR